MLPLLGCLIVEQLNVYRLPSQSDKKMSKCFFFLSQKYDSKNKPINIADTEIDKDIEQSAWLSWQKK